MTLKTSKALFLTDAKCCLAENVLYPALLALLHIVAPSFGFPLKTIAIIVDVLRVKCP